MTGPTNVERVLDAFLAPESDRLPDRVVDSALAEIARTPQRPALRVPWRSPLMSFLPSSPFGRVAVALVAAVAVIGGSFYLFGNRSSVGPAGSASPSPTSTATAGPSATPLVTATPGTTLVLGLQVGPGLDGSGTIVFGLHDDASDSDRLYAMAPDGSNVHVLAESGACCMIVDPMGYGVMVGIRDSKTHVLTPNILTLPVNGGLTEGPWTGFAGNVSLAPAAWSQGYDIAFLGYDTPSPANNGIYLSVDNGGGLLVGEMRRLTHAPTSRSDIPIAFDRDSTMLLFVRTAAGQESSGDLYVIGIDGTGLRKLNPAGVLVSVSDLFGPGASWSPDGTRVAFAASDVGSSTARAYVVDAKGGAAQAITGDSQNMTSARWSPDGTWILYDLGAGSNDLWLAHPDGSGAHRITTTSGSCCGTWSPDSSMILFEGNDAGGAGLFIANADGSGYSRLITLDNEYLTRWRGWGPLSPVRS